MEFSIDGEPTGDSIELDENGQVEVGLVADVPAGNYTVRVNYVDDTADIADFGPSSASFVLRVSEPATPVVTPTRAVVSKSALIRFGSLLAKSLHRRGSAGLRGRTPVFAAAVTGTLLTKIYARPPSSARASRVRRVLVAAAQHTFTSASSRPLRLHLTRKGKRLIRHAKRLNLEIRTRFVPTSGSAVSAVQRAKVTRRRSTPARPARLRDRGGSASGGRVLLTWNHRGA